MAVPLDSKNSQFCRERVSIRSLPNSMTALYIGCLGNDVAGCLCMKLPMKTIASERPETV